MTASDLIADRGQIELFVSALFRYAPDDTFASLRAFDQVDSNQPPLFVRPVKINGAGLAPLIDQAVKAATDAATGSRPCVFTPPIATFSNRNRARAVDLAAGLTLSVEIDERPAAGLRRLETLLGPATVVVQSGSSWLDPETGELQLKVHAHWRLSEPTTEQPEHDRLHEARALAMRLVGADPTGVPIVHPLRWPGSWNVKSAPKMARNSAINAETEIHLQDALERLQDALEAAGLADAGLPRHSGPAQAEPALVAAAMAAIPNADVHYNDWIRLGYAGWRAAGGDAGFDAWEAWSKKSGKYDAKGTEAAWARISAAMKGTNPPRRIGAGTIFFTAKQAGWTWPRREQPGPAPNQRTHDPASTAEAPADARPPAFADEALAQRFTEQHQHALRYVAVWGRWLIREPAVWRFDDTLRAFDLSRALCRQVSAECNNPRTADSIASAKTVAAVERLAKADRRHAATTDLWDSDPWLLNTPGGVVNLHTGMTRAHHHADYMTKVTAVSPGGDCPLWRSFLNRITAGDAELQAFLQRVAGYCLTGSTREHALFFGYGTGGNGKGVFLNTLTGILGGYATVASIETFTASAGERHPTDLAMLRGARLVTAQETEEGRRWAESRIKALTGGDPVTARFMRQDFFTFQPAFKLFIAGNHKPGLRNVDEAIRRRLHLIPFEVKIPAAERDHDLPEKLKAEWPGILAWAIQGCVEWGMDRLAPPDAVVRATDDYLEAEDAMGLWIGQCCLTGAYRNDTSAALFGSWKRWAEAAGEQAGSQKRFGQALQARGFTASRHHGTGRGFEGVAVAVPAAYSEAATERA